MKNIRVANIIEEGRLGGPQVRISEVASLLQERYNNIYTKVILPIFLSENFQEKLNAQKIPFKPIPLHRLGKGWKIILKYLMWFPVEIVLIWKLFRKESFDVIHVSGGSWQVKGVLAGKLSGAKVLWHLNDTKMPSVIKFIFRFIAKFCADGFIVAGNRVKKYYVHDLGFGDSKPVFVIQAPVDCNKFDPSRVQADERIGSMPGLKIVSVGNVSPVKGFEYFLQMASKLNQQFDGLSFSVVGPHWDSQKGYTSKLKKLQDGLDLKNLLFYGSCSDVRAIHKAADIYVCSSVAEASPLSVWEAMAMGKAIVATDVGDISRFIEHGKSGFIVPPESPEKLAEYVGRLVENPELRAAFGSRAREIAVAELDVSIVARHHAEAYESILNY